VDKEVCEYGHEISLNRCECGKEILDKCYRCHLEKYHINKEKKVKP